MDENDLTRLSEEEERLFEELFGEGGTPLTPEEKLEYNALFGESHPQEPHVQLSEEDAMLAYNYFGSVFEKGRTPVTGTPVNHFDPIGPDLRARILKAINVKLEEIRGKKDSQWSPPERKGEVRALTRSLSDNATLGSLADIVGLDADDAIGEHGWLRDENGMPISEFKPSPSKAFSVPNTVFVDLGAMALANYNPLGNIPGMKTDLYWINIDRARSEGKYYAAKGFKIVETDNPSRDSLISHLQDENIFAYVFAGHGGIKPGYLSVNNENSVSPARYTLYKINHMTLWACESLVTTKHQWNGITRDTAGCDVTVWNTNVFSKGWVEGYIAPATRETEDILKRKVFGSAKLKDSVFDQRKKKRK